VPASHRLKRLIFGGVLLLAAVSALPVWYFWPLLRDTPPDRPGPGWTPAVRLLAGTGADGHHDGDAFRATFSDPFAVALGPDGVVYVADAGDDNAIRRLGPNGEVTTVAGGVEGFADGVGATARFNTPSGLALDASGVLYVADTGNHAIRRVDRSGRVTTVAGDGVAGWRDGAGGSARFNGPIGLSFDAEGRLLVADTYNDRIRAITKSGEVITVAGEGVPGLADGPALAARFDTPTGLAVGPDHAVYVADTGNELIRRISPDGTVTTVQAIDFSGNAEGLVRRVARGQTLRHRPQGPHRGDDADGRQSDTGRECPGVRRR
jgi:hypothetical protein